MKLVEDVVAVKDERSTKRRRLCGQMEGELSAVEDVLERRHVVGHGERVEASEGRSPDPDVAE